MRRAIALHIVIDGLCIKFRKIGKEVFGECFAG
jgi:hypothetical protein